MTNRFHLSHHLDGVAGQLAASGLNVVSTFLPGVTAADIRCYLAVFGSVAAMISAHLTHRAMH
jgi:hypothetical protein